MWYFLTGKTHTAGFLIKLSAPVHSLSLPRVTLCKKRYRWTLCRSKYESSSLSGEFLGRKQKQKAPSSLVRRQREQDLSNWRELSIQVLRPTFSKPFARIVEIFPEKLLNLYFFCQEIVCPPSTTQLITVCCVCSRQRQQNSSGDFGNTY